MKHYHRLKRYGDPLYAKGAQSIQERIDWYTIHEPMSGCHLWLGPLDDKGYARLHVGGLSNGSNRLAYRLIYERAHGPVPEGLQLDHLCRVRCCVNPAHLEPVTARENTLRGLSPSALAARQTHCKNGHSFDEANTRVRNGRERQCRACDRESWYKRKDSRQASYLARPDVTERRREYQRAYYLKRKAARTANETPPSAARG